MAAPGVEKKKDPGVISVRLIYDCIEDDDAEATKAREATEITVLQQAKCVNLGFKNLIRIENLGLLKSLRKLCLDNNMIAKIEGLETLTSLTWLDLSFNKISKIEGLDKLTALTDLSLFNNEIKVIEGLEANVNLQCLSLGNNLIDAVDQILYLKRLPKLRVLALQGCPITKTKGDQYAHYCLAFLPGLRYLDYALISAAQVATAKEVGVSPDFLMAVEQKHAERLAAATAAADRRAKATLTTDANVETPQALLAMMLDEDPEMGKLRSLPKLLDAVTEFRASVTTAAEGFHEQGVALHERIGGESKDLQAVLDKSKEAQTDALRGMVATWEASLTRLVVAAGAEEGTAAAGGGVTRFQVATLSDEAEAIRKTALANEIRNYAAVCAMLEVFESAVLELRARKLQLHEAFFRNIEAVEGGFHAQVVALGEVLLENVKAGTVVIDADDDLSTLAHDREALLGSILASHDYRLGRLGRKELELKNREVARCEGVVQRVMQGQKDANRERVEEVWAWYRSALRRLDDLNETLATGGGEADSPTASPVLRGSARSVVFTGAASGAAVVLGRPPTGGAGTR